MSTACVTLRYYIHSPIGRRVERLAFAVWRQHTSLRVRQPFRESAHAQVGGGITLCVENSPMIDLRAAYYGSLAFAILYSLHRKMRGRQT